MTTTTTTIPQTNSALSNASLQTRWFSSVLSVIACLFAIACAPRPPVAPATTVAPLHDGPLTDFVAAAGLRWMAVARLAELAHTPGLSASRDLLFPTARLDAFALATGLDLRETANALAAGYDLGTLYMAETPSESALVEARFRDRLLAGATTVSPHPQVKRISGAMGLSPETLVRVDAKWIAVAVGDPTPARAAELFALGRLTRSPPALRGSALSTLPHELDTAPLRFYASGPFSGDWARGARGLLGAALAFGVAAWPEGAELRVRAVLSGRWEATDAAELSSAWTDLSESSMGRLLGLDQPAGEPRVTFAPDALTFDVRLAIAPLTDGLRAAVAADVWEILRFPQKHDAPPP
jgi:hypothetical protein